MEPNSNLGPESVALPHPRVPDETHPFPATTVTASRRRAARLRRKAQRHLDRGARAIGRLARRAERHRAGQLQTSTRLNRLDGQLARDPRGGMVSAERLQHENDCLQGDIAVFTRRGSSLHRRMPRWLRPVPYAASATDLAAVFYFMASVLNVDLRSPVSTTGALALMFAVIVTLGTVLSLTMAGLRLRARRDAEGGIAWGLLDGGDWLVVGSSLSALIAGSALMFTRIREDVLAAFGAQAGGTAITVALAVAVIVSAMNVCLLAVHAFDGSVVTERLDEIASVVGRAQTERERLQRKIDAHQAALDRLGRQAHRRAALARSRSAALIARADGHTRRAFAHHQGSWLPPLPEHAHTVDDQALRSALEHLAITA